MAKPEQLVINKLKRDLKEFADTHSLHLTIDKPPAGMMNSGGRPDLFIDLGPFHFRVETKAEGGAMTQLQVRYANNQHSHDPLRCWTVVGKNGVDLWMAGLSTLLDQIAEDWIQEGEKWLGIR